MTMGVVLFTGLHDFCLLPQGAMCSSFLCLHDLGQSLPGPVAQETVGVLMYLPGLQMSPRLYVPPDVASVTHNPWA